MRSISAECYASAERDGRVRCYRHDGITLTMTTRFQDAWTRFVTPRSYGLEDGDPFVEL